MTPDITVTDLAHMPADEWDAFVRSSANGTIFHTRRFLAYHPEGRFDFRWLGFVNGEGRLLGVLPAGLRDGILSSPAGASYGGICTVPGSFRQTWEMVDALQRWARREGIREVRITQAPVIYTRGAAQDLHFAMLYAGFENDRNLFSSVIDLDEFGARDPLAALSESGRRAIRKAEKSGLVVEESDDLDAYYPILVENKRKFGVAPAHTREELERIRALVPGTWRLFAVRHEGEMAAGVLTTHCNSRVMLAFYIASRPEHQLLRPVNLALFHAARVAAAEGYRHLDLGVSMNTASDNPMEPAWSLISFKEFIGSRGFLRPSFRWRAAEAATLPTTPLPAVA